MSGCSDCERHNDVERLRKGSENKADSKSCVEDEGREVVQRLMPQGRQATTEHEDVEERIIAGITGLTDASASAWQTWRHSSRRRSRS